MNTLAAEYLVVSYFQAGTDELDRVSALLQEEAEMHGIEHGLYMSDEGGLLVQCVALDEKEELVDVLEVLEKSNESLAIDHILNRDVQREILFHRETVKPQTHSIPDSRRLQIRYIEVPRSKMGAYHEWRQRTIFDYARNVPEVYSFEAYHSLASGAPGVKFLVGFDVEPDVIQQRFTSDEYKRIIADAGQFIVGGSNSLSTKFFHRIYW